MRKDFVSQYQSTGFYTNLETKTYGVCINIKDINKKAEIIKSIYNDCKNKETIKYLEKEWRKEE